MRTARPADAEAVHHVLGAAFADLKDRRYFRRALEAAIPSPAEIEQRVVRGDHVLVAEIDGQMVGTVTGVEEHEAPHVCSLGVPPASQRQGIARRLMDALARIARQRGCHKVWLQTAWAMIEAIALYERLGYEQDAINGASSSAKSSLCSGKLRPNLRLLGTSRRIYRR